MRRERLPAHGTRSCHNLKKGNPKPTSVSRRHTPEVIKQHDLDIFVVGNHDAVLHQALVPSPLLSGSHSCAYLPHTLSPLRIAHNLIGPASWSAQLVGAHHEACLLFAEAWLGRSRSCPFLLQRAVTGVELRAIVAPPVQRSWC